MKALAWLMGLLLLAACAGTTAPPEAVTPTPVALAASSEMVTAMPDAAVERGRAVFRNKGCVTCHTNSRVEGETGVLGPIGPDLMNYTNDPAFLQRWLADPPAVRPGTQMPNLRLSAAEIEDLIAFLNEPR